MHILFLLSNYKFRQLYDEASFANQDHRISPFWVRMAHVFICSLLFRIVEPKVTFKNSKNLSGGSEPNFLNGIRSVDNKKSECRCFIDIRTIKWILDRRKIFFKSYFRLYHLNGFQFGRFNLRTKPECKNVWMDLIPCKLQQSIGQHIVLLYVLRLELESHHVM